MQTFLVKLSKTRAVSSLQLCSRSGSVSVALVMFCVCCCDCCVSGAQGRGQSTAVCLVKDSCSAAQTNSVVLSKPRSTGGNVEALHKLLSSSAAWQTLMPVLH